MEYYQDMQATKLKENENKYPPNYFARDTSASTDTSSIQTTPTLEKTQVLQWLHSQLPHMSKDDASDYATHLDDLGFDSVAFIEEELIEDDLSFMKTAHRRVLMRRLSEIRAVKGLK